MFKIFRIASKIPLLQTLLLHGNKIGDISTTKDPSELFGMISSNEHLRSAFNSLLVLALNFCGISSWNTLRDLSLLLPSVQELYIAGNSLTDLFKLGKYSHFTDEFIMVNTVCCRCKCI
jgi:hypothetical protein